jgi:alkylresorcinol/alkylpyrone synthase
MKIAAVASALPPNAYDQATLTEQLRSVWAARPEVARRLDALHHNARVDRRHLTLPRERYEELETFGEFNDAWIEGAVDLGERAVRSALARAGLGPEDVDAIFFTTVTGVCSPSVDARLVNRLGLRGDVQRTPMFGLGCVAGVSVIARASDYVRAWPERVAVALSVELCSLTWQRNDTSIANLIACGLFADGAAAVIVKGERCERGATAARILGSHSSFYPDTEDVMGWRVSERGFQIVLSPAVPAVAREFLGGDVDRFLGERGLARGDIAAWIAHPGGPKVLEAVRDALALNDEQVGDAWEVLRTTGNLSSTSVLLVLERTLELHRPPEGALGLMVALGPGFCSEQVLLRF